MTSLAQRPPRPDRGGWAAIGALTATASLMLAALLLGTLPQAQSRGGLTVVAILSAAGSVMAFIAQRSPANTSPGPLHLPRFTPATGHIHARLATFTAQLRSADAATRIAAIHALGGLADECSAARQQCIDLLCAYLRQPYDPAVLNPGHEERKVRSTVVHVIAAHLRTSDATTWQGYDLDFTGATFDAGSFAGACFPAGTVSFAHTWFSQGHISFSAAQFCGATVDFTGAIFDGSTVDFACASLSAGHIKFTGATLTGGDVDFSHSSLAGGIMDMRHTRFIGARINFSAARFTGATIDFTGTVVGGGSLRFTSTLLAAGSVDFTDADLTTVAVDFAHANLTGARMTGVSTR